MRAMDRNPEPSVAPDEDDGSPTLIGPFTVGDPYGAGFAIPGPLTAGRPKPEPGERWTLGPGHVDESPEVAGAVATAPVTPHRPSLRERLLRMIRRRR
jgi:hypothetical protein